MNKKVLLPVLGAVLLAGTFYTTSNVLAQNTNANRTNIVQKIAERFGLAETEVQAVFDEGREEHQAQMQANFETKLGEAVANGEITADQKALIIAKHEELKAKHEANRGQGQMKDMTAEEREAEKTKRQAERGELESWAEANGIDMEYFGMGFGGRDGHGMGGSGMKGNFGGNQAN